MEKGVENPPFWEGSGGPRIPGKSPEKGPFFLTSRTDRFFPVAREIAECLQSLTESRISPISEFLKFAPTEIYIY